MTKLKIEGWIPSTDIPAIKEIAIVVEDGVTYIMKVEYIEIDCRDEE